MTGEEATRKLYRKARHGWAPHRKKHKPREREAQKATTPGNSTAEEKCIPKKNKYLQNKGRRNQTGH